MQRQIHYIYEMMEAMPNIEWNENQPIANVKWNADLNVQAVYMNGEIAYAKPGSQIFTSNETFIVPAGITEVSVCMCGGGGSGAALGGVNSGIWHVGGGGAAGIDNFVKPVTPGQVIEITIGQGGARVPATNNAVPVYGNNGTRTYFGTLYQTDVGVGGSVAENTIMGFKGNGELADPQCISNGPWYNGLMESIDNVYAYGGNGRSGNGGRGDVGGNALDGTGYGSGGGGATSSASVTGSGKGSNGYCKVTWG